jgi:acyl dehydratase
MLTACSTIPLPIDVGHDVRVTVKVHSLLERQMLHASASYDATLYHLNNI